MAMSHEMVYPKYQIEIEIDKSKVKSLTEKEQENVYKQMILQQEMVVAKEIDFYDKINRTPKGYFKPIKQKQILHNEKIDIASAIRQLNEYQKELKNRADTTLSRSEQQKCLRCIEDSKKLQFKLVDVINKLCELEK